MSTNGPYYVFDPPPISTLPVVGEEIPLSISPQQKGHRLFPIHRVYCVGKNYADHVKEMGGDVTRSQPVFFTKPSDAVIHASGGNSLEEEEESQRVPKPIAYPPHTSNLHYECELVVAIGKSMEQQQQQIPLQVASDYIFGFAVGLDLTRRDLQSQAKANGLPWDTSKYFDQSAPMGGITTMMGPQLTLSDIDECRIELTVNGVTKQSASLSEMIWSVPEIISELSSYYQLKKGDLIMTGTPEGVGPVQVGDRIVGRVTMVRDGVQDVDVVDPVDVVLVE